MERNLSVLAGDEVDLLVVGGGVYGAAAAREAALRGLSVALIERDDFSSGVSWNSAKTIHGGFRYLQKLDLRRVRDSICERRRMLRLAPHLIRPLEFAVPTRGSALRSRPALGAALALYGALGVGRNRGLLSERRIAGGGLLSAEALRRDFPGFDFSDASGAAFWSDAQMISSERVVLGLVQAAAECGARVANHVEARGWLQLASGRVGGVRALDRLAGSEFEIRARRVLNCAGPWAWELLALDPAQRISAPPMSRAANIVLRREFPSRRAIGIDVGGACPARGEQVLFLAPWRGRTILGTLHLPMLPAESGPLRADLSEAEIARLLDAVNRRHPDLKLEYDDVAVTHVGVQAIQRWHPHSAHAVHAPDALLIDHARQGGPRGVISLVGVKFTEACGAAARAVELVSGQLGAAVVRPAPVDPPLPGGDMESLTDLCAPLATFAACDSGSSCELDAEVLDHLAGMYGTRATGVIALADSRERASRVTEGSPVIGAEVVWAVREEMAHTLADIVLRRTELAARGDADEAAVTRCAEIAAHELAWCPTRTQTELAGLRRALLTMRGRPQ